jgi:nitrite reductase/ring-hydroxylating ferredoxin subunit
MPFVKVATVAEVPPGRGKAVMAQGWPLALFNVNGTIYAIDDACPHKNLPLAGGLVAGTDVICPFHGARFDLCTGAVLSPPARKGVRSYKVQVAGEDVLVEVP